MQSTSSVLTSFGFKKPISIPNDAQVIFVSDMFVEDYPYGGAELTSDALIKSSPFKVYQLHSSDVSLKLLEQGHQRYWIFGNFSNMDLGLIPTIVANIRYSILEYDYKFCRYRSPQKHFAAEGINCDCEMSDHGKVVSAFFHGARSLWWMSEQQKAYYESKFIFLKEKPTTVLSSVFDDETFTTIKLLREKYKDSRSTDWLILGSTSWVKGTDQAKEYCVNHGLTYQELWQVPYIEVLDKMAHAAGFVYLPNGMDTCPRMVIEAKLLGCKLQLNDYVQHAKEEWFDTDDIELIESYLYMARSRFWNGIDSDMGEAVTTISGYTTTYNCFDNDYPFIESIMSMLGFCHEVIVVDSGSSDDTWEALQQLAIDYPRVRPYRCPRDKLDARWALQLDGRQKALARSLCKGAFCWQQDSDEIVSESDYQKIAALTKKFPQNVSLLALPVIEYWGSTGKVRCDIHNWKWRLSRNVPGLTHGIPMELRRWDDDGNLYAAQGTDSCDPIWLHDYSRVQFMNFYPVEVEQLRQHALQHEDAAALRQYEEWYNEVAKHLPCVHHYSWFNIERKIKSYKNYWARFWESMYNMKQDDTPENNMFFDKSWRDVTDAEIEDMAIRLEQQLGGWIFHKKVNLDAQVPHIRCTQPHPDVMAGWIERNQYEIEE